MGRPDESEPPTDTRPRSVHSPTDAADLLFAGRCTPRCLLPCDGRYHAALTFAPVLPTPEIRDVDGRGLGVRPSLRVAS